MALRGGMRSFVIIYITHNDDHNNNNNNNNNLLTSLLTYLRTAIEFSVCSSSPYTSTDKTHNNKDVMQITEQKFYNLAAHYTKLKIS